MSYKFDFSKYNNIAVFPHQSPDGDAIGSAVAMALYLKKIGKKAVIVIDDEVQYEIRFLCDYTEFIDFEEAEKLASNWDFCVAVDCADFNRLDRRKSLVKGKELLNIDHHHTNTKFGDYNIVYPDAPAACEIIYMILKENEFDIDVDIAEAIYTGISTDTGNFLYDNVTERTFRIASELLKIGIDKNKIVYNLYQNQRLEKIKIFTVVMQNLQMYKNNTIAIAYVDEKILEETGASILDTEGISEALRDIQGVEISCFLKETRNQDGNFITKGSMRCLPQHDVSKIAEKLGGGGHRAAAGFNYKESRENVQKLLLEYLNV